MFTVYVEGVSRYGEFTLDGEDTLTRTSLEIEEPMKDGGGDVLEVSICDSESADNLKQAWMVLWGTPREIVRVIDEEYPMAKMETDAIFNYLDTLDPNDTSVQFLAYSVTKTESQVIRGSALYKKLRQLLLPVVASLFERPEIDVMVLRVCD